LARGGAACPTINTDWAKIRVTRENGGLCPKEIKIAMGKVDVYERALHTARKRLNIQRV